MLDSQIREELVHIFCLDPLGWQVVEFLNFAALKDSPFLRDFLLNDLVNLCLKVIFLTDDCGNIFICARDVS